MREGNHKSVGIDTKDAPLEDFFDPVTGMWKSAEKEIVTAVEEQEATFTKQYSSWMNQDQNEEE